MSSQFLTEELTADHRRLVAAIREFAFTEWRRVRHLSPYAFFLSSSPEGTCVISATATEASLMKVAKHYLEELKYEVRLNRDPLEVARAVLRWANPDDGWLMSDGTEVDDLSEQLLEAIHRGVYKECDGAIARICIAALGQLDTEGAFGDGDVRERVTIGFRYLSFSDSELFEAIRAANPDCIAVRAASEILTMGDLREYFGPPAKFGFEDNV